jgi:hypothetical protein
LENVWAETVKNPLNFKDYYWNDFLNPIVVKEAQEGVRERVFTSGSLLLLISLGVLVIHPCLATSSEIPSPGEKGSKA